MGGEMKRALVLAIAIVTMGAMGRAQQQAAPDIRNQTTTDHYTRYELQAPGSGAVKVTFEVSATTAGAREFVDPTPRGSVASDVAVTDLMTGSPLAFTLTPAAVTIGLARPVPANGQGRIRIVKTLTDAAVYARAGDLLTF